MYLNIKVKYKPSWFNMISKLLKLVFHIFHAFQTFLKTIMLRLVIVVTCIGKNNEE